MHYVKYDTLLLTTYASCTGTVLQKRSNSNGLKLTEGIFVLIKPNSVSNRFDELLIC